MEHHNRPGREFTHGATAFKKETGFDWPEKEDWEDEAFRRLVKWRYKRHLANGKWIVDQIHAEYPQVHVSFNTHFITPLVSDAELKHWYTPLTWTRWAEAVPLWRFPSQIGASNHAKLGPSNPAQNTPFWLSLASDLNPLRSDLWQPTFAERFQIAYWHIYSSPQMNISADELGLRMSALAAFTYKSQIWMEGNIRDSYGTNLNMYTRINDAIHAREKYFGGDRVKYCGVYLSNNTRDFWGLRQVSREDPKTTDRLFTESFFGLTSILMSEHIQYSHIFDNTLDQETLDAFPVIILSNVACLSNEACESLRDYVKRGGRLIASYETSLYDEWGNRRKDFGLSDLFGISYQRTEHKVDRQPSIWVRELTDASLNDGQKGFSWETRCTRIKLLSGTKIVARETGYFSPGSNYREDLKGQPVIVRNRVGKGEAIYIIDDFSQGYYQAPFRTIKLILRNLIELSPPPLSVHAPSQIIMNSFWQKNGDRLVVHLLNLPPMSTRLFEPSQRSTLDDIVPVHDVVVTLDLDNRIEQAYVVPSEKPLKANLLKNGYQQVIVPVVAEHEMVVFEFK